MTLATYITIFRILLIPVFAAGLLYYNFSPGQEAYRWVACAAFLAAGISDAIDGWVARRFRQGSELGALLDPLADKALMLSAVITLSVIQIPGMAHLPVWYLVLVLGRDMIQVTGFTLLHMLKHDIKVRPHWTGKVATCLQLAVVSVILLKLNFLPVRQMIWTAGFFTFASLVIYMSQGLRIVEGAGPAATNAPGRK